MIHAITISSTSTATTDNPDIVTGTDSRPTIYKDDDTAPVRSGFRYEKTLQERRRSNN
jgi:hypothetical protein